MTIERCIIDLLFAEDCVIIPGLGGFVSQYQPARIQTETSTFIPPSKEIAFQRGLEGDHHRLAGHIAERMNLSVGMAGQRLEEWVRNLKRKIERGDRVFIEGIGSFLMQSNGELRFNADQGINFLIDSYGLFPFHFREVEHDHDRLFRRVPIVRKDEPLKREMLPGTESPKKKKIYHRLTVAIAIPILLILMLVPFNSRISQILTRHPASIAPLPSLFHLNMPEGESMDTSGREISFPIGESEPIQDSVAELDDESMVPEPIAVQPGTDDFPVIAGSFKSEWNARKLERELTSRGYPARILPFSGGWIRVSIESYSTLSEAQTALYRLVTAEPDLSLWIRY